MSTRLHGTLSTFDRTINILIDSKASFTVKGGVNSKKISVEGNGYGEFTNGRLAGSFLCAMLKRDLNNYMEKNGPHREYGKFFNSQLVNDGLIKKNLKKVIREIDINWCYWETAFMFGWITEETYLKGISKPEYKEGRLAAIGSLNKKEQIYEYKDGKLIKESWDHETYDKYNHYYWKIVNHVWDMMYYLVEMYPNDLYMWLTDCAFINIKKEREVIKFFKGKGYTCKKHETWFKLVDEEKGEIKWWADKDKDFKSINYMGKEMERFRWENRIA